MNASIRGNFAMDTIDRQKSYVAKLKKQGDGLGIVFADAFIRGMRELGYKSPSWALAEVIDNAVQASATVVEVAFGFTQDNESKPDMLAVIDNGVGMIAEMIPYAVRWGGTDRENDRNGFGRFGYGLPSAAVSLARRYTVYSKVKGGSWHSVSVDLEKLARVGNDAEAIGELLQARPDKELPAWLHSAATKIDLTKAESGTVVVLEDPDRLRRQHGWIRTSTLSTKLLQDFGVIYRHWLKRTTIVVAGEVVEPVDPLFLMEHARLFDETSVRAKKVLTKAFAVSMPAGETGTIRIRAALLPADFQHATPEVEDGRRPKMNKRHTVMKNYNGLLICREGRQIDCYVPDWTKFQNFDVNVKIEIDFDATLDDYFGITTSKQQITIDDLMLEKLKQPGKENGGIIQLVKEMRAEYEDMRAELNARMLKKADDGVPRPSENAMDAAERFKTTRTPTPSDKKAEEADRNLKEEAEKVARKTGKSRGEAEKDLQERTTKRRWEVDFQAMEEGPFYIPKRLGNQKRIIINTAHPFYSKVYEVAPEVRSALEVLICVLADGEIDAEGERERFYKSERQGWSESLRHALAELKADDEVADRRSAREEADLLAESTHSAVAA